MLIELHLMYLTVPCKVGENLKRNAEISWVLVNWKQKLLKENKISYTYNSEYTALQA